ncbi:MAG: Chemotaxis protein CheD [Candidatus Ozemobacter sibiricus]|jgi:chemotaxis protein CheD|uniref:Probable chemoreceptor glutamine deamidase CheD n=1 Tax=Candidatus Ozemobacter sibiricus TaxID=2268124 RepID=A0A367ZLV3_9BACT|nr:MAG: Chemotaxis protein CheD [Candidatus Ozemobacter sibiricus]
MPIIAERSLRQYPPKVVNLHIGQLFACRERAVLRTLLGSCVSACLFDPVTKVCGMNHILLPGQADLQMFNESARYGINAMEVLINEMTKLGALRSRLQAKVFGGGHVLATVSTEKSPGLRNVEFVLEYLRLEGIPIKGQDTGGSWTRVIQFHTDTFEVFVKKIRSTATTAVMADEEKLHQTAATQAAQDTDITLFDE